MVNSGTATRTPHKETLSQRLKYTIQERSEDNGINFISKVASLGQPDWTPMFLLLESCMYHCGSVGWAVVIDMPASHLVQVILAVTIHTENSCIWPWPLSLPIKTLRCQEQIMERNDKAQRLGDFSPEVLKETSVERIPYSMVATMCPTAIGQVLDTLCTTYCDSEEWRNVFQIRRYHSKQTT